MALKARKIAGRHAMVGRSDGKKLYRRSAQRLGHRVDHGAALLQPKYARKRVRIGNCASPPCLDLVYPCGAMPTSGNVPFVVCGMWDGAIE
jgi:hypothetical protein